MLSLPLPQPLAYSASTPVITTIPPTPCGATSSKHASSSNCRLLYRGDVLLADNTVLKGVTLLSRNYSPFLLTDENSDDGDLCLALEMVRGSLPVLPTHKQDSIEYGYSGNVEMYIDPREQITLAFFERVFIEGDDRVLLLYTNPQARAAQGQEGQLFVTCQFKANGQRQLVVGQCRRRISRRSSIMGGKPDDPLPRVGPTDDHDKEVKRQRSGAASGGGTHLSPGRRGEKRLKRQPDRAERSSSSATNTVSRVDASARTDGNTGTKMGTGVDNNNNTSTSTRPNTGIDSNHNTSTSTSTRPDTIPNNPPSCSETNKKSIKRLITHQLLGQGYEKGSNEFSTLFTLIYNGTLYLFRQHIDSQELQVKEVVRVVNSHVHLYCRDGVGNG
ncbi:unnamed protein product [Sympodiomycopsis kandeliae]